MVSGTRGMRGQLSRTGSPLSDSFPGLPPLPGTGVISNEQALTDMFQEFVALPLVRHAAKAKEGSGTWAATLQAHRDALQTLCDRHTLLLTVALGATAAAAAAMLIRRRV